METCVRMMSSFGSTILQAGRKPKASEKSGKMSQNFLLALSWKPRGLHEIFEWKFSPPKVDRRVSKNEKRTTKWQLTTLNQAFKIRIEIIWQLTVNSKLAASESQTTRKEWKQFLRFVRYLRFISRFLIVSYKRVECITYVLRPTEIMYFAFYGLQTYI